MRYIERYDAQPLAGDQRTLDAAISERDQRLKADKAARGNMQLADDLALSAITANAKLAESVDRLWDFYTQAAICSDCGVCSSGYIRDFLGPDASNFFHFVHPYICPIR